MDKPAYEELEKRIAALEKENAALKAIDRVLQESEEQFRLLYERAPLGYQSLDENGNFVEVNDAWLDTLGYSREEVIGKWFGDFLPEEYSEVFRERFPKFKKVGAVVGVEFEMIKKDGSEVIVSFDGRIGYDEKGIFKQTHCIFHDITERKRFEEELRESEEKYRSLVEEINDLIYALNVEGIITYISPPVERILGYKPSELENKHFLTFVHPDDRELLEKRFKELLDDKIKPLEYRMVHKNGNTVWVRTSSRLVCKGNKIVGVRGMLIDITESKKAENMQKVLYNILNATLKTETLEKLLKIIHSEINTLMESKNFYVALYDKATDTYTFPYFVDEYDKYAPSEPVKLSKGFTDYVRKSSEPLLIDKASVQKLLDKGEVELVGRRAESWMGVPLLKAGEPFGVVAVQSYSNPVAYNEEDLNVLTYVSGHIAMAVDRKKSEEAIVKEKDTAQEYLDIAGVMFIALNNDGIVILANKKSSEILGYEENEILGASWFDKFLPERLRKEVKEVFRQLIAGNIESVEFFENPVLTKNGEERIVAWHNTILYGASGEIEGILSSGTDMTDRKLAEDALLESELKYRTLIENTNAVPWQMDIKSGKFTFVGSQVEKLLGYPADSWTDMDTWAARIHQDDRERAVNFCKERTESGEDHSFEYRAVASDGTIVWIRDMISVIKEDNTPKELLGFMLDVTESKTADQEKEKLLEQLYQAQKMESIGRLAGGIAHDFNNILTGIMGYAELLKLQLPDTTTPEGEAADVISQGAERAAELTKQLLGFARGGKYNPLPLNINKIIRETVRVSEKIFEKNIVVTFDFEEGIHTVEADKNQLDQVLTNIIINAKDAMPGGGDLIIQSENVFIDDVYATHFPEIVPGDYVKISITDNGTGMPKDVIEHIFEPFFSTKGEGKGTGLGLATVYGIVKNHGGHLNVYSEMGEGTTFNLYLPVSGKKIVKDRKIHRIFKGDATILVVDDEKNVRRMASRMLNELGYKVLLAEDGKEAVKIYKVKKREIDLVLLDMVMPNMGGKETNLALRKIDPGVKILLSSGYSQDGKAAEILNDGALGFIQKPFRMDDISKKLNNILKK
ncbi:PAS domain S-box protein [candidate division KSB1 bacterium]